MFLFVLLSSRQIPTHKDNCFMLCYQFCYLPSTSSYCDEVAYRGKTRFTMADAEVVTRDFVSQPVESFRCL